MKTKIYQTFVAIVTMVITCLFVSSCLENAFIGDTEPPTPEPQPEEEVRLLNAFITHDWKYSNGLIADNKKVSAKLEHKNGNNIRIEDINPILPLEISWEQPEPMTRGTNVFTLDEASAGDSILISEETNDNLLLKNYQQTFTFNFDGVSLKFETKNQLVFSKYKGINLPNCVLDSIVYNSQKAEIQERYYIGSRPYLRSKVTFDFDVYRHHTDSNNVHKDKIYPYIIVNAPEEVEPGEDIFNGAVIISGTEKLFFNKSIDTQTKIYTSQVDVWEFWTQSGKKRTTYSVDLEVKQWIDDAQKEWIVPNIEFGYPKLEEKSSASEEYSKQDVKDYVFEKQNSEVQALWSYANNYKIGVYGYSEKAWKTYKGLKVLAMPSTTHKFYYDKYTYSDFTEKVSDGTTYLAYPAMIYFNAVYNNDIYKLNQAQEFWVEKGSTNPPAPQDSIVSEKIIYELENNNGKWISKIIFRRKYAQTGERDSVAIQELSRSTKIDDDKHFIRPNNTLNLKKMLEPVKISENTKTDANTGHVITTIVRRHGFDFDFFTYNIEETYQTAYTMYKGERLNFLAPEPTVEFAGQTPKDLGLIVTQDGKKYNRTEYTVKYKETYGDFNTMYYPLVNIDVEDTSVPETDDIVSWSYDRERDGFTSKVILHITRKLSGRKDSTITAELFHAHKVAGKQTFYCEDSNLSLGEAINPNSSKKEETKDGVTYVTTTTVNKFRYNLNTSDGKSYYDEVTTTDVTAFMSFQGTRIDFLAPETSKVSYSGSNAQDKGEVTQNGKKYNLVTYTNSYKEVYDGKTETLTSEADLYVKPASDDIISWSYDRERDGSTSKVILHIIRKLSGSKDSTITAELSHSHKVAAKQSFYCADNSLSLADALNPSSSKTEETKDGVTYVTTTTVNKFGYNLNTLDKKTYYDEVTTTDVTAFMSFQGTRIDFLAPETSKVSYSGSKAQDKGEVTQNGQKYNLTTYTHSYKELYDGKNETLTNTVDLYVKPAEVIRTEWKVLNQGLEKVSDTQWRSYFTLNEKFSNGTETNTDKEVLLNIYVQAPQKRNLVLNSAELSYKSFLPKSTSVSTRSGGENISVTTNKAPYDLVYTNKENELINSEFVFVSETAVYKDGDVEVNFKTASWTEIQENGFTAPLQGIVGDYDRYNATFKVSGKYNNIAYHASALVDIDVLRPQEPTLPPEWGDIDVTKTKNFGGLAWSWKDENGKPVAFITGTIVTEYGIVSFWEGDYCFTKFDTSKITARMGNSIKTEGPEYLIPAYINILKDPNPRWGYQDINGRYRNEINGVDIKLIGMDVNKPFLAEGGNTNVYKINGNHVVITYNGNIIFDEVFAE